MRTRIAVVVAIVGTLATVSLTAQECRKNQRWLLVTILEMRLLDPDTGAMTAKSQDFNGQRLFDLCDIAGIRGTMNPPPGVVPQGLVEVQRSSIAADHILYVTAESPKQLCAVLPGCSDATAAEDP